MENIRVLLRFHQEIMNFASFASKDALDFFRFPRPGFPRRGRRRRGLPAERGAALRAEGRGGEPCGEAGEGSSVGLVCKGFQGVVHQVFLCLGWEFCCFCFYCKMSSNLMVLGKNLWDGA